VEALGKIYQLGPTIVWDFKCKKEHLVNMIDALGKLWRMRILGDSLAPKDLSGEVDDLFIQEEAH